MCTFEFRLLYTGGFPCENFGVGIGDRSKVDDSQLTASTFLGNRFRAFNARLDSPGDNGWCSSFAGREGSYLEIDLRRDFAFCGIRLQGGDHGHVDTFQLRFAGAKEGPFTLFDTVREMMVQPSIACHAERIA